MLSWFHKHDTIGMRNRTLFHTHQRPVDQLAEKQEDTSTAREMLAVSCQRLSQLGRAPGKVVENCPNGEQGQIPIIVTPRKDEQMSGISPVMFA